MVEIPAWWFWASGLYFIVSLVWSVVLIGGAIVIYQKTMPLILDTLTQTKRITEQANAIVTKTSNTVDALQVQTQHFLTNAERAGSQATQSARSIGATVTVLLIAARVMNFVRRIF